jgi:hypothetical protein
MMIYKTIILVTALGGCLLYCDAFDFKYFVGTSSPSDPVTNYFFCPIIDASYIGKTVPIIGETQVNLKAVNCFDLDGATLVKYNTHTIVSKGNVIAKPDLYDSIRGAGFNVQATLLNVIGQIILLVQGSKFNIDLMKLTITKNGKDVVWMKETDYLIKNYCSNFIKRMTKAVKDADFIKMGQINQEVTTCTAKAFWDRLDQDTNLKASKDKVFSKCLELASKIIKITGEKGQQIIDALELIKTGIELVEEVIPESDDSIKSVLSVFQQYRTPIEMYLKYGQDNNKFSKLDVNPRGKNKIG